MTLANLIVADVMRRLPIPSLTQSMRRARRVRIGPAYRMGRGEVADEWTGIESYVARVCADGFVELCDGGLRHGGLFVSCSRVETLAPQHERDGVPTWRPWDAVVGKPMQNLSQLFDTSESIEKNLARFELRLVSPWCCSRVPEVQP